MLNRSVTALMLVLLTGGLSCAVFRAPPPSEDWLAKLSAAPPPPPGDELPLPPTQLERVLRQDFEVRGSEEAGGGVMGARRIEAYYPSIHRTLKLKWKTAPEGGDGWNNSPRREIAAYLIQKWFLPEKNYVVPPTAARCIALDDFARIDRRKDEPNLPDGRCVFGLQAAWLENVEKGTFRVDRKRFYREASYARNFANYNLLMYLIANRDTGRDNRLIAKNDANPRVFSVDNGISFGEWLYNFFLPNFDSLRVPALPRDSVERLRAVGDDELEALLVVAEFHDGADGILRETKPSPPFDPEHGARIRGGVLQLGIAPDEIAGVRKRLHRLIASVDAGEIPLF